MKKGFSLIAAIFFIILIATTAITALSIATMSARSTANAFLKEQAVLLAQGATEFAVMTMQSHYHKSGCDDGGGGTAMILNENLYKSVAANQSKFNNTASPVYLASPDSAILKAGGTCLKEIYLTYPTQNNPLFNVEIKLYYLNSQIDCTNLALKKTDSVSENFDNNCDISMMVDVNVKSTDPKMPISYRRRTLQTLL